MLHHVALVSLLLSSALLSQAVPRAILTSEEDHAPRLTPAYHQTTSNGVTLHLVRFDSRDYQLKVIDQPSGPGSKWRDSASVGKSHQALAAINAGFFTPEGAPLGRLITDGTKRGGNNPSSLGSGFLYSSGKFAGIARRKSLNSIIKSIKPTELLQAGPMLCYRGKAVSGLSSERRRPRSFVANNGSYYWLIGYAESASLSQLSKVLSGNSFHSVEISQALNLDGGRSSDLWISSTVESGNRVFRSIWNKPVRNFLILTKK